MTGRILLADQDKATNALVARCLEREGYHVTSCCDGGAAFATVQSHDYDLLIMDLTLPSMSGWELLSLTRHSGNRLPVIVLTERSDEVDKVAALELGADDYVTKPFSPRELVSRVRAHLRRLEGSDSGWPQGNRFVVGALTVDKDTREVDVNGVSVRLTAKEFDLLAYISKSPGKVFSRSDLLEQVWGRAPKRCPKTVDVYVARLGRKLGLRHPNSDTPFIESVRGVGYRLVSPKL